ncbi:ANTAR domain-containing protein [Micromonospora sp. NPDC050397]|uniref:ANTAR domain-containing protein n=1 Tax=Micromonospora sp. NPDC050397 TaxID=3364279 RepID=UPI00384E5167
MPDLPVSELHAVAEREAIAGAPGRTTVCVVPLVDGFGSEVVPSVERSVRELSRVDRVPLGTVVVDLGETDTLAAVGMNALLAVRRSCREVGVQLRVVASAAVRRVLERTDVAWRGSVYASVREAMPGDAADGTQFAALGERLRQREQQLASLPVIEQAKGMLMRDFGLGPDEAFEVLRNLSQTGNVKLRDVAARVTSRMGGASEPNTDAAARATHTLRARLWVD